MRRRRPSVSDATASPGRHDRREHPGAAPSEDLLEHAVELVAAGIAPGAQHRREPRRSEDDRVGDDGDDTRGDDPAEHDLKSVGHGPIVRRDESGRKRGTSRLCPRGIARLGARATGRGPTRPPPDLWPGPSARGGMPRRTATAPHESWRGDVTEGPVPGSTGAAAAIGTRPDPRSVPGAPTRVVIVDDHALVREGTVELLAREPGIAVVGQAGSGEEGLELIEALRPDVALVDVSLPGMNGLELAREIKARELGVHVLVVSAYDDYAYVAGAMEVGVRGYLLKTATGRELVDAVRAVADGIFVLDHAVSLRLARRWRDAPRSRSGAGVLTPRESDVLALLARGRSNKQIAMELALGLRTVEGHVSGVLAKLGAASRTEAVAYALRDRLVTPDDRGRPADAP